MKIRSPLRFLSHFVILAVIAVFDLAATQETLGPSSRRTGLVMSEIMYHPQPRGDGLNAEFIEVFNSEPSAADLSGFRLSGDVDFTFPANTVIPSLSFLVVAPVPADVQNIYGLSGVLGGFGNLTNSLPNDSGTLRLRNRNGAVLLEVNYADDPPWPAAPDGAGHSLVLARPSLGEGDPRSWAPSVLIGGSPGAFEPANNDPLSAVVINEFLAHTDDLEVDFVEFYNHGNQTVDLSGCILTDDPLTNKFVIPTNASVPARGFVHFTQTSMSFALSAEGETIYLKNPASNRVVDAVRFGSQENGVSSGRSPDGANEFHRLAAQTPGAANSAIRLGEIVINEIMYHPISEEADDQYIELHNRSGSSVTLSGWRITGGIGFTLPANAVVAPDGYVVVAENATRLLTNYSGLTTNNTFGNFSGQLSGRGERVALTMPDTIIVTNATGNLETNRINITVDEVTYGTGGRWPKLTDGGGSSLELIDHRGNHRLPSNWAASDESAKAPWTLVQHTGILDNGTGTPDSLQILLQGPGECLVDDVEVLDSTGANRISNSSFEGDGGGWVAEGTQSQSGLETNEGYTSLHSFHVRAVERGDDTVNRIRASLTAPLTVGSTATLRARARWLGGHPELLFRLRGNYLEAIGRMTIPKNLGTPGARNSRAGANAGPAIYEVVHSPVLPAANQSVVVTARVDDPDPPVQVTLNFRLDPNTSFTTQSMFDDGTGGDTIASDGIFSATIPGQANGAIVAFYIQASDGFASPVTTRFPGDTPMHEGLIRFGENKPAGSLGTYRIWMTQATFNTWRDRHELDNSPLDITFVYNDQRIIYNTSALYAGSPYIAPGYNTPVGSLCGYTGGFPDDDRFLGTTDLVLDWPGRDSTAVQEQYAYWLADEVGLPNNYRRFIRLHVNGVTETSRGSIYEDVQQPGAEIIKEWVPDDSDGQFFKIERWFEFSDAGSRIADPMPTLQLFTTTDLDNGLPIKKLARYRWNWLTRVVRDSANDYTNLFALVDAVNAPAPEPYTSQTTGLVDIEQWMGIFAAEHIINNFDSYGHSIGKNMYAYKPTHGKWQMHMFDIDWVMLASIGFGLNTNAPLFDCNDPTITRMYNHPPFRRAYFRTVKKAVEGPMAAANVNPWLDAKYAGLLAEGVTRSAGQSLGSPAALKTWIQGRRSYLLQQLATVAANFAITSNNGNDFTANTNVITLAGTAPIEVQSLRVNGVEYPTAWTDVKTWSIRLLLSGGQSAFTLEGTDSAGNALTNLVDSINITHAGSIESPVGRVIINEIMYNPVVADAEFVEIYNQSATTAFDLSGWRLNGVDFTFEPGTILDPGIYLVVTRNRSAFIATFGINPQVAGAYAGQLDNGGETLSLIRPGATPEQDQVIDTVTYDDDPPWSETAGTGSSLQLIDPDQENYRVANWGVMTVNTNTNAAPQWQYVTLTGTATASRLYVYMTSPGDVHIDDLKLVAGGTPETGTNYINNGDFESPFPGPWTVSPNLSTSTPSDAVNHSGNHGLHVVSSSAGSSLGSSIWQDIGPLVTNATYTLSYWYLPSTNGSGLTIRLSGNGVNSSHGIAPPQSPTTLATPGGPNSVRAVLPTLPPLWLNEILPNNITGILDNAGDRDPWVEIYNGGTNTISLAGWYLSDNFTNLTRWAFPGGTAIGPNRFLLVWLDAEPGETTPSALHTDFRIPPDSGALALVFPFGSQPAVLDYVKYSLLSADRSLGFYPDGRPSPRQVLYFTTPGATNDNAMTSQQIFINEWMAANTVTLADPADGNLDDWFELYNPNDIPVDLAGYSLSDNLTNAISRWSIPTGAVIPAKGFLLVWADEDIEQNDTNSSALHAGFRLSQSGESIGLFAPNGSLVDSVTFGAQTNDVSQGRWPDGTVGQFHFMTTPTPHNTNVIPANPPAEIRILSTGFNADGDLLVTWSSEAGKPYRVQFKEDLNQPAWSDLEDLIAVGPQVAVTDVVDGVSQRFYRIQLVTP
jgi:hypothetical protein